MAVSTALLDVRGPNGNGVGRMRIAALDGARAAPIWIGADDAGLDGSSESVQIVEASEYVYELELDAVGEVRTDRDEIFQRDDLSGRRGRLRPAEHVGLLPVTVFVDGQIFGTTSLEVRSRKLDYMSHYRWMLRDIATTATGILTERFAPTQGLFEPKAADDPDTLYQQFAFLYAFITGPQFESALAQVLSRPHRAWLEIEELRPPAMGLRGSSALLRKLVGPGPRQTWMSSSAHPLGSLPIDIRTSRSEETLDTAENRFVRFALEHWRSVVMEVREVAERWTDTPSRRRALLETAEVLDILGAALGHELFREVGHLRRFPASSSVLHRREGYRELFFAYLETEIASGLTWDGGQDVFGAGLRNVAMLYEYWTFLQLVEVVRGLCPHHDVGALVEASKDRMSLNLTRRHSVVVSGTLTRLGRRLDVALFFNKTFSPRNKGPLDGSWSAPLRPDCSVKVSLSPGTGTPTDVVWLHFDAKYRIEKIREVFGEPTQTEGDELREIEQQELSESKGDYKIGDLLKMHAYLAAIRRATGAYVLYPGTETQTFERYEEILPGLGAFPLSPSETGVAEGASSVASFLDAACTHLANQATQEERSRYWNRVVFEQSVSPPRTQQAVPFLERPPADTQVLVTPVISESEFEWVRSNSSYVIPDQIAGHSTTSLAAFGADLLIVRAPGRNRAWRMKPFELRLLADGRFGADEDSLPGRLAVPLAEGPFALGPLMFSGESEGELLWGSLGDFLELADGP